MFSFLYHCQYFYLTWLYIWVTRRVSYKKQELFTRVHPRFVGGIRVANLFICLCCPSLRLYVLSSVLWHPLWCPHQNDVRFVFTSSCCSRRAHVLFTLFVLDCVKWCPTYIVLCFCFVFLRLVYPMLSVSLDCPFLVAPLVFFNVYFS
jgi:hypothetical protein